MGSNQKELSMLGLANVKDDFQLGGGALFWVYISPMNQTKEQLKGWAVTFSQGNWSDSITSNNPTKTIKTPNLSGTFNLEVTKIDTSTLPPRVINIPAAKHSSNIIGCNTNCASMVGIVAQADPAFGSANAEFWTTWDAMCIHPKDELIGIA